MGGPQSTARNGTARHTTAGGAAARRSCITKGLAPCSSNAWKIQCIGGAWRRIPGNSRASGGRTARRHMTRRSGSGGPRRAAHIRSASWPSTLEMREIVQRPNRMAHGISTGGIREKIDVDRARCVRSKLFMCFSCFLVILRLCSQNKENTHTHTKTKQTNKTLRTHKCRPHQLFAKESANTIGWSACRTPTSNYY